MRKRYRQKTQRFEKLAHPWARSIKNILDCPSTLHIIVKWYAIGTEKIYLKAMATIVSLSNLYMIL